MPGAAGPTGPHGDHLDVIQHPHHDASALNGVLDAKSAQSKPAALREAYGVLLVYLTDGALRRERRINLQDRRERPC